MNSLYVLWLRVFCDSSLWCLGLVCCTCDCGISWSYSHNLLYYIIIYNYFDNFYATIYNCFIPFSGTVKTITPEMLWINWCTVCQGRRPRATECWVIHSTEGIIVWLLHRKVWNSCFITQLRTVKYQLCDADIDARGIRLRNNGGYVVWFGHFKIPITSLFVVRNIKRGYSFS